MCANVGSFIKLDGATSIGLHKQHHLLYLIGDLIGWHHRSLLFCISNRGHKSSTVRLLGNCLGLKKVI